MTTHEVDCVTVIVLPGQSPDVVELSGENYELSKVRVLVVPAYTRRLSDFRSRVAELLAEYEEGNALETMSVGDLGLWLLAKGSEEPRFIEGKG